MNGRWGIDVDIEGFSKIYQFSEEHKTYAIAALAELMGVIWRIGTRCYPGTADSNYSERLFAHQYGDGFLVCSDFPEADGSRATAIAISIMRHMILCGYTTQAAICTGNLSDISGFYPEAVRESERDGPAMGHGVMTTMSVMGTALTKAHALRGTQKGAALIVDEHILGLGLPEGVRAVGSRIDWVSSKSPLADEIARKAQLKTASASELYEKLRAYCARIPVPPEAWIEATFDSLCGGAA